ncbi:unnamed protein product, partial [Didymodactylos carnosus]
TKHTFFKFHFYFDYEKRPKKQNGIDNISGKSANAQLRTGKKRNKSENKDQSNEQQMKNILNQVINRNNEESKNLSKNLTNSLNVLKDQMIDILDERQLKVKTHQLSNSMLENAHKIAQESLALNAIKMKSKMENTILKTSEMTSNKNDKSSIPLKLNVDHSEKQNILLEKTNFISNLQNQYRSRMKHFQIYLNENIKTIKNDIKLLKSKGKNILFKIDIDSLKHPCFIHKNNTNQIDLSDLLENESNLNNDSLLNQDLSSLTNNFQSLSYDRITKTHEPFLLNQYFKQLNNLKGQKRSLIRIKHQLTQFNSDTFINDLCL